jgi:hypothetical protein
MFLWTARARALFIKLSGRLADVPVHFQKEPPPPPALGACFLFLAPNIFCVLYLHPPGGLPPFDWGTIL